MAARPKPNAKMIAMHQSATLTARQIARMRAGRVESVPADYADLAATDDAKRRREVRRAIEDRKMMAELGLD